MGVSTLGVITPTNEERYLCPPSVRPSQPSSLSWIPAPLDGPRLAVKDLIDVAGVPTTSGSKYLAADALPAAADAACLARGARRRRPDRGEDQPRGARLRRRRREPVVRHPREPARRRPDPGRLVERLGGGRGERRRRGRARHRHRGLGAHPGGVLRGRRASRRRTGACRSTACGRSHRRSTPSARWRARSTASCSACSSSSPASPWTVGAPTASPRPGSGSRLDRRRHRRRAAAAPDGRSSTSTPRDGSPRGVPRCACSTGRRCSRSRRCSPISTSSTP